VQVPDLERHGRGAGAVVVVLVLVLCVVWSVLTPYGRGPDEVAHVDLAVAVREGKGYPPAGAAELTFDVSATLAHFSGGMTCPLRPPACPAGLVAEEAPSRIGEATWRELVGDPTGGLERSAFGGVNQMTQHPPPYYAALATIIAATALDDEPVTTLFGVLRLVNCALAAGSAWLLFAASRRVGAAVLASAAVTLALFASPQVAFIGSVVNNDNILLFAASLVTYMVARVLTGDTSSRTAVLLGLSSGLLMLTKAFGLFVVPVVVLLYLWVADVEGGLRVRLARLAQSGGPAALVGGWWWVASLVNHGTLQPHGLPFATRSREVDTDVWEWATTFGGYLAVRWLGWVGNFGEDLRFSYRLAFVVTAGVTAALVWAAVVARRGGTRRRTLILLVVPLGFCLVVLTQGSLEIYLLNGAVRGQSRYLFGALPPLALIGALALRSVTRTVGAWTLLAVLAVGAGLHLRLAGRVVARYWGDADASLAERLGVAATWSALPTWLVIATFAMLALVCAAVASAGVLGTIGRWPRDQEPLPGTTR
jgi:4-amino-4-deoxy-L-arabinose transferase-like glycosyltransferase